MATPMEEEQVRGWLWPANPTDFESLLQPGCLSYDFQDFISPNGIWIDNDSFGNPSKKTKIMSSTNLVDGHALSASNCVRTYVRIAQLIDLIMLLRLFLVMSSHLSLKKSSIPQLACPVPKT